MSFPGYMPVSDDGNRARLAALWDVPFDRLSAQNGAATVEIMQAAHAGRIRGRSSRGENPMRTDPNLTHAREALQRLDFLVVQDIFATETTAYTLTRDVWIRIRKSPPSS